MGARFLGDAGPGVRDLEGHVLRLRYGQRLDGEPARRGPAPHGLDGVGDQVGGELVEAMRVTPDGGESGGSSRTTVILARFSA